MFHVYDRYLMRQLLVSTLVVSGALSLIILLTQSLRLIELVLESNASAESFIALMALSLPRFFEAVLPASVLIATLFVFNRLAMDSEMVVLRASGASPLRLARPVITTGLMLVATLLVVSLWVSPSGISEMQTLRREIRNQYTHLLFKEGIFNSVGKNLTAYVRARAPDGQLKGLMVHDTRGPTAVTVVARGGHILNEKEGQKIVVYDGSRQERDATGKFSRLDFKQYTLDIPTTADSTAERWREPDERTLRELTDPSILATEAPQDVLQFKAELHRRLTTPVLMLAFALMGAVFLLQGPFSRAGAMPMVIAAALSGLALQGMYLMIFNIAKKSESGIVLLYAGSFVPVMVMLFFLTSPGETLLARIGAALRRIRHAGTRNGRRP